MDKKDEIRRKLTRNKEDDYSIIKVLELCRDIELKVSALYLHFSDVFKNNTQMSALWKKTSQEEDNHAKQFELAIKLVKQDALDSVSINIMEVEKYLKIIELEYDRAINDPPSFLDALKMAINAENLFLKLHMTSIASFTDLSYQELFNAMMKHDKEHIETLTDAYNNLTAVKGTNMTRLST